MSKLSFILQYITKPRTVGAILPSSKYLAKKMTQNINFESAKTIVEYGPGTGVFTDRLLKLRKPDTSIFIFENNKLFCDTLKQKYEGQANFYIINDSAQHVGKYLAQHNIPFADCIISGLPFASIPESVSIDILKETKKHLGDNGKFITFQYTLLKKDFIGQFFSSVEVTRELRNVPPAYVLCCRG